MVAGHARPRLTLVRKERALSRLSGKEWARAKPRSRKERTGSGMVAGHPLDGELSADDRGTNYLAQRRRGAEKRGTDFGIAAGHAGPRPSAHAPLGKEWALAKPQGRKEGSGSGTVAGRARPSPTAPVTSPPRPRQSWARAPRPRHRSPGPPHPLCASAPLREKNHWRPHQRNPPQPGQPQPRRHPAPWRLCVFARKNAAAETAATRHGQASRHPAVTQPLGGLAPWREQIAAAEAATFTGRCGRKKKARADSGRARAGARAGARGPRGAFYGKMPRSWYAVLMASRAREYAAMRMFTPRSREKETTRW